MLTAASTRFLAAQKNNGTLARQLRLMSSMSNNNKSPSQQRKEERRKFHSTSRREADAATKEEAPVEAASGGMASRFLITAEVTGTRCVNVLNLLLVLTRIRIFIFVTD